MCPIEENKDENDNRRRTTRVENMYANNAWFVVAIATTSIYHQFKLAIYPYKPLIEGFPTLVSIQTFITNNKPHHKRQVCVCMCVCLALCVCV